jgi:hypothetical protein
MRAKFIFLLIFSCLWVKGLSQIRQQGIPFLKNFLPDEYRASPKNYGIIQDQRGMVF